MAPLAWQRALEMRGQCRVCAGGGGGPPGLHQLIEARRLAGGNLVRATQELDEIARFTREEPG